MNKEKLHHRGSGAQGKKHGKTAQVARIGNMVCPPMAEALIRANYVAAPVYITTMAQLAGIVSA